MKKILFLILGSLLFLSGCSTFYVLKQGAYQLQLLAGSEAIEKALRVPNLDRVSRKKLMLIQEVREYSQTTLKLKADKNYRNVNLSWDKTINNVSASDKLAFKPYTWWFPVIGAVPYKGYFDEQDAIVEEERLKKLGLDTIRRKVGAYSTLGFFEDPVWPNMLRLSDESLVELIIHELTHATLYIPNQTPFNETFANFVGQTGARYFFAHKYGPDSHQLRKVEKYQRQTKIYNDFFSQLFDKLEQIYRSEMLVDVKIDLKINALKSAETDYQKLALENEFKNIDWSDVNNAYLLSFKRYNHDDKVFEDLFQKSQENFGKFLREVALNSHGADPFLTLRAYLDHSQGNK